MLRFWPYFTLFAEVVVFYRKALFAPGYLIPWDLVTYFLPLQTYVSQNLRRGHLPLWDPHPYCGVPFFANLQAQLWYPPSLITILLSGFPTGRKMLLAMEWHVAAHVFLGGVGVYWLLRRIGAARAAATLGGTIYQLGAYFASVAGLGPTDSAAWMPLAWLAVFVLKDGFRWRWTALLAFFLSMATLGGFPAATAVVLGSSILLALLLLVFRRSVSSLAGSVPAALVLASLVAAVQLIPSIQVARLGESAHRGVDNQLRAGAPLASLITLVRPNYFHELDMDGYKEADNPAFRFLYCGLPGLALGVAALALRRDRLTAIFALLTLAALLWTLGSSTPVAPAVYRWLPNAVRAPIYVEFTKSAFVLGLAVLAGLGMNSVPQLRQGWLGVALVAVAAADLIAVSSGRRLNTGTYLSEPIVSPEEFEGSAETLSGLRRLTDTAYPPWRIESVGDSRNWTRCVNVAGVFTPRGDEPFYLKRVLHVRQLFCPALPWDRGCEADALRSLVLDFLNVRYVISWGDIPPPAVRKAALPVAARLPGHTLYERPAPLPRFFLVGRVKHSGGLEESLQSMQASDFNPRETAIVEGLKGWVDSPAAGHVDVLDYKPESIRLRTESSTPALLVSSEAHYPGWQAYVDGLEQPIQMTNGAYRGLVVPAGRHTVEMRFRPVILWYSAAISLAALCLLVWMARQPA